MEKFLFFFLIAVIFTACSNNKSEKEHNKNSDQLVLGFTNENGDFTPLLKQGPKMVPVYRIDIDSIGNAQVYCGVSDINCGTVVFSETIMVDTQMYVYPDATTYHK